jgi:hypothetical protein
LEMIWKPDFQARQRGRVGACGGVVWDLAGFMGVTVWVGAIRNHSRAFRPHAQRG